jgi:hypothetical protein
MDLRIADSPLPRMPVIPHILCPKITGI